MSQILIINSQDRVSGTPEAATFSLPQAYFFNKIELLSANIPLAGYNVNSYNNVIYWNSTIDGNRSAAITPGYYDSTSLPAAIVAAMNPGGDITYTVTFSTVSGGFTITPSAGTMKMTFGTNTTNSAHTILGFTATDGVLAATAVSNQTADLSVPRALLVSISNTVNAIRSTDAQDIATFVIPTTQNTSNTQNFNLESNFAEWDETRDMQSFNMRLTTHGNVPYVMNGVDYMLIVRLTKK